MPVERRIDDESLQKGSRRCQVNLVHVNQFFPHIGALLPDHEKGKTDGRQLWLLVLREVLANRQCVLSVSLVSERHERRNVRKPRHVSGGWPIGVGNHKHWYGSCFQNPWNIDIDQKLQTLLPRRGAAGTSGIVVEQNIIPLGYSSIEFVVLALFEKIVIRTQEAGIPSIVCQGPILVERIVVLGIIVHRFVTIGRSVRILGRSVIV
mmetsp:Transcript_4529/g.10949  ORF Transcript_4529/g.10949 Transcript_4529/m.10949 type:complete len:207 (+) Transcript_4529:387-1007(+)